MDRIEPKEIRYVKLGAAGAWEGTSLSEGRIYWGDKHDPHELALSGDWKAAERLYAKLSSHRAVVTGNVSHLRDFYTLGSDCLWITFAQGFLWWAFAEPEVVMLEAPTADGRSRYRKVIGAWCNETIDAQPLAMTCLSSRLTQLAGYRRSMCSVREREYLLRRINAEPDPIVEAVHAAQSDLVSALVPLIQQMHWSDFEVLVDLLMGRIGARRISRLGGTLKDYDLIAELPATRERIGVQVKSAVDQATLDQSYAAFSQGGLVNRFILACHSPKGALRIDRERQTAMELWDPTGLATRAFEEGLTRWIVEVSA